MGVAITLQAATGEVVRFPAEQIESIIEIDGRPFEEFCTLKALQEEVTYLGHRLDAIAEVLNKEIDNGSEHPS